MSYILMYARDKAMMDVATHTKVLSLPSEPIPERTAQDLELTSRCTIYHIRFEPQIGTIFSDYGSTSDLL